MIRSIFRPQPLLCLLAGLLCVFRITGAAEVPAKQDPGIFTLQVAGEATQEAASSPLNPNIFAGHKDERNAEWSGLYNVKRILMEDVQAKLAVVGGQYFERGELATLLRVQEAALTFTSETGTNKLTLGKERTIWSQDTVFHPIDVVGRYNYPKSAIGKNADDPFLQEGVFGAKLKSFTEYTSYEFLIADARKNTAFSANWQVAAKLGIRVGVNDVTTIFEKSADHPTRWGLSLSRNLGESWTFYSEYLHAGVRELPVLRQESPIVAVGPNLDLPARYTYAQDATSTRQIFLASFQHNLEAGSIVEVGYYFNGHGYTASEWKHWLDALHSAASTFSDARYSQFFPSYSNNPYAAFLGESALLARDFYLRRNYLHLRWDSLNTLPFGQIEFNELYGLDDHSATSQLVFTKALQRNMIFKAYLMLQRSTPDIESGLIPVKSALGANVTISF